MRPSELVDSQGKPIPLGALLGKGGEGAVFEVSQTTAIVAKVYHKPLSQDRTDKIQAMMSVRTDVLSKLTSWPIDLVRMRTTGQPIGLLMPRVSNKKNIHHLYGPKSRLQDFPRADWRFLVRAGTNIARAFAVVHDAGCVVGDVNHGSIMVGEDATVCLIDCDSFQVNAFGRQFLCEVGIETFTPPELQGLPFRGVLRTPNYDNFGLAVMIFHLLFMGRHPFAGRFSGAGDMPIARAIKECRFPYGANQKAVQMSPPPGTPLLSFVGGEISALFEAAFSQLSIRNGRPTARTWVDALQKLETNTKRCASNPGHWHPTHLAVCPWCHMEAQGANPLFPFVVPMMHGVSGSTVDLDALWRKLSSLPVPEAPFGGILPNVSPSFEIKKLYEIRLQCKNSTTNTKLNALMERHRKISLFLAAITFVLSIFVIPKFFFGWIPVSAVAYYIVKNVLAQSTEASRLSDDVRKQNEELQRVTREIERLRTQAVGADMNYRNARNDWERRAGSELFDSAKRKFSNLRDEIAQIPEKRLRSLDQLKQSQRKIQLDRFLDRFQIEDAKIEGIGPGRKRTLESYGIETAEDIDPHRIDSVPGFGPKMADRLMRWRRSVETKFVFDPAKAIDARDVAKVEQEILALRIKLETSAKAAFEEALQAHARMAAIRQTLKSNVLSLQAAAAQAQADYEFLNRQ